jgi:hypothetical protein
MPTQRPLMVTKLGRTAVLRMLIRELIPAHGANLSAEVEVSGVNRVLIAFVAARLSAGSIVSPTAVILTAMKR